MLSGGRIFRQSPVPPLSLPLVWSRTHALVSTWPLLSPTRSWCEPQPWKGPDFIHHEQTSPGPRRALVLLFKSWPSRTPSPLPHSVHKLLGSRGVERVEKTPPDTSEYVTACDSFDKGRTSHVVRVSYHMHVSCPAKQRKIPLTRLPWHSGLSKGPQVRGVHCRMASHLVGRIDRGYPGCRGVSLQ